MVISRTPYRISFLGGGTDYPQWYEEFGGAVLTTTIDKYCYVFCKELLPYFEHNIRVVYSVTELASAIDDIEHPVIRETLRLLHINNNIEIQHSGDLPARSGLASSSAFTAGLTNALYTLQEKSISTEELASLAYYIERVILNEDGGKQDQYACTYGGMNIIKFPENGKPEVKRINLNKKMKYNLQNKLMLFYLGGSRISSEISKTCINNFRIKRTNLHRIHTMVADGEAILRGSVDNLDNFGVLLDEYWQLKKDLSECVSNEYIDNRYEIAKNNGAIGGKLLGAGGGGCMLLYVPEEYQENIIELMKPAVHVPFKFDFTGSRIVYS